MQHKCPCSHFVGERESAWDRETFEEEEGRRKRRMEGGGVERSGGKSLKGKEERLSGRPGRKGASGSWNRRHKRFKVCVRVDLLPPGSRWAGACSCVSLLGLDEFDFTMRSDPVLFTSNRGELLNLGFVVFLSDHEKSLCSVGLYSNCKVNMLYLAWNLLYIHN